MEQITGAAPVQYWGTVNGRPFYFRSRYEHWTFAIADDMDTAIDADTETETVFFRKARYGIRPFDASYMSSEEAERIVRACATEYLSRRKKQD